MALDSTLHPKPENHPNLAQTLGLARSLLPSREIADGDVGLVLPQANLRETWVQLIVESLPLANTQVDHRVALCEWMHQLLQDDNVTFEALISDQRLKHIADIIRQEPVQLVEALLTFYIANAERLLLQPEEAGGGGAAEGASAKERLSPSEQSLKNLAQQVVADLGQAETWDSEFLGPIDSRWIPEVQEVIDGKDKLHEATYRNPENYPENKPVSKFKGEQINWGNLELGGEYYTQVQTHLSWRLVILQKINHKFGELGLNLVLLEQAERTLQGAKARVAATAVQKLVQATGDNAPLLNLFDELKPSVEQLAEQADLLFENLAVLVPVASAQYRLFLTLEPNIRNQLLVDVPQLVESWPRNAKDFIQAVGLSDELYSESGLQEAKRGLAANPVDFEAISHRLFKPDASILLDETKYVRVLAQLKYLLIWEECPQIQQHYQQKHPVAEIIAFIDEFKQKFALQIATFPQSFDILVNYSHANDQIPNQSVLKEKLLNKLTCEDNPDQLRSRCIGFVQGLVAITPGFPNLAQVDFVLLEKNLAAMLSTDAKDSELKHYLVVILQTLFYGPGGATYLQQQFLGAVGINGPFAQVNDLESGFTGIILPAQAAKGLLQKVNLVGKAAKAITNRNLRAAQPDKLVEVRLIENIKQQEQFLLSNEATIYHWFGIPDQEFDLLNLKTLQDFVERAEDLLQMFEDADDMHRSQRLMVALEDGKPMKWAEHCERLIQDQIISYWGKALSINGKLRNIEYEVFANAKEEKLKDYFEDLVIPLQEAVYQGEVPLEFLQLINDHSQLRYGALEFAKAEQAHLEELKNQVDFSSSPELKAAQELEVQLLRLEVVARKLPFDIQQFKKYEQEIQTKLGDLDGDKIKKLQDQVAEDSDQLQDLLQQIKLLGAFDVQVERVYDPIKPLLDKLEIIARELNALQNFANKFPPLEQAAQETQKRQRRAMEVGFKTLAAVQMRGPGGANSEHAEAVKNKLAERYPDLPPRSAAINLVIELGAQDPAQLLGELFGQDAKVWPNYVWVVRNLVEGFDAVAPAHAELLTVIGIKTVEVDDDLAFMPAIDLDKIEVEAREYDHNLTDDMQAVVATWQEQVQAAETELGTAPGAEPGGFDIGAYDEDLLADDDPPGVPGDNARVMPAAAPPAVPAPAVPPAPVAAPAEPAPPPVAVPSLDAQSFNHWRSLGGGLNDGEKTQVQNLGVYRKVLEFGVNIMEIEGLRVDGNRVHVEFNKAQKINLAGATIELTGLEVLKGSITADRKDVPVVRWSLPRSQQERVIYSPTEVEIRLAPENRKPQVAITIEQPANLAALAEGLQGKYNKLIFPLYGGNISLELNGLPVAEVNRSTGEITNAPVTVAMPVVAAPAAPAATPPAPAVPSASVAAPAEPAAPPPVAPVLGSESHRTPESESLITKSAITAVRYVENLYYTELFPPADYPGMPNIAETVRNIMAKLSYSVEAPINGKTWLELLNDYHPLVYSSRDSIKQPGVRLNFAESTRKLTIAFNLPGSITGNITVHSLEVAKDEDGNFMLYIDPETFPAEIREALKPVDTSNCVFALRYPITDQPNQLMIYNPEGIKLIDSLSQHVVLKGLTELSLSGEYPLTDYATIAVKNVISGRDAYLLSDSGLAKVVTAADGIHFVLIDRDAYIERVKYKLDSETNNPPFEIWITNEGKVYAKAGEWQKEIYLSND